MLKFTARIYIIGVNPYVLLPANILRGLFKEAGKEKGAIPIKGTLDGNPYIQTLVKYSGKWRLYLNIPMRKATGKDVGDQIEVCVQFDPAERSIPIHPRLKAAFLKNKKAARVFENLSPSKQKEIVRYISFLKTEVTIDKNITRAIAFLAGNGRFVGRDKP
ncbi:MAG TPA: YdeI/OmpD-associated family protein [Bacteroidia bacterium]|jgi:hypothetical protein|nr:YdeI/OmpD-associated family protein [Bacteroidia bacterium]